MKLTVKNKKEFVNSFLSSISNLNDVCVLKTFADKLQATLTTTDGTLILQAEMPAETDIQKNLNIPDVKKFIRVLDNVDNGEGNSIDFEIINNAIKFVGENNKFTFHLLEDGIAKAINIDLKRIDQMGFDISFKLQESTISTLMKGSSFATETNKLYIFCENNKVLGELGDKTRHNADNFQCVLSKEFTGTPLTKTIPLNFETFRLINFNKTQEAEFNINSDKSLIKITLIKGEVKLIYIIAALIK